MNRIQSTSKRNQQKDFAFYSPKGSQCQYQDTYYQPIGKDSVKRGFNSFIAKGTNDSVCSQKQIDISTPLLHTERNESIQNILAKFAQQNKKLIKERSSLFKKNCQLSKRIKNLEMHEYDNEVQHYNENRDQNEDQNYNCENQSIGKKSIIVGSQIKVNQHKRLGKLLSPASQIYKTNGKINFTPGSILQSVKGMYRRSFINNQEEFIEDLDITQKQQSPNLQFIVRNSPKPKTPFSSNKDEKNCKPFSMNTKNFSNQLKQKSPEKSSLNTSQFYASRGREQQHTNYNYKRVASPNRLKSNQAIKKRYQIVQSQAIFHNIIHSKTQAETDDLKEPTFSKKSTLELPKSNYPKIVISPSIKTSKATQQVQFSSKIMKPSRNRSKQIHRNLEKHPSKVEFPNVYVFSEQEDRRLSMTGNKPHMSTLQDMCSKKQGKPNDLDSKIRKIRQQNNKLRQQLKM